MRKIIIMIAVVFSLINTSVKAEEFNFFYITNFGYSAYVQYNDTDISEVNIKSKLEEAKTFGLSIDNLNTNIEKIDALESAKNIIIDLTNNKNVRGLQWWNNRLGFAIKQLQNPTYNYVNNDYNLTVGYNTTNSIYNTEESITNRLNEIYAIDINTSQEQQELVVGYLRAVKADGVKGLDLWINTVLGMFTVSSIETFTNEVADIMSIEVQDTDGDACNGAYGPLCGSVYSDLSVFADNTTNDKLISKKYVDKEITGYSQSWKSYTRLYDGLVTEYGDALYRLDLSNATTYSTALDGRKYVQETSFNSSGYWVLISDDTTLLDTIVSTTANTTAIDNKADTTYVDSENDVQDVNINANADAIALLDSLKASKLEVEALKTELKGLINDAKVAQALVDGVQDVNIATNTTNIDTNTTNITVNKNEIVRVEDKVDGNTNAIGTVSTNLLNNYYTSNTVDIKLSEIELNSGGNDNEADAKHSSGIAKNGSRISELSNKISDNAAIAYANTQALSSLGGSDGFGFGLSQNGGSTALSVAFDKQLTERINFNASVSGSTFGSTQTGIGFGINLDK